MMSRQFPCSHLWPAVLRHLHLPELLPSLKPGFLLCSCFYLLSRLPFSTLSRLYLMSFCRCSQCKKWQSLWGELWAACPAQFTSVSPWTWSNCSPSHVRWTADFSPSQVWVETLSMRCLHFVCWDVQYSDFMLLKGSFFINLCLFVSVYRV